MGVDLLKTLGNAKRCFGAPETVAIASRILSLALLLLLAQNIGAWALVVGLWGATLLELIGIMWILHRKKYRYSLIMVPPEGTQRIGLFRKLMSTLPYVGATQIYVFVLDAMVSHLAQGHFAIFRYAMAIWSRTAGIFLRPLSVPFFTAVSETIARSSQASAPITESALARVIAVMAVVTAAVLAGAEPVLTALWGSDKLPQEQIRILVWMLAGLYALLPIWGTTSILRKLAVSLHLVRQTYLALAVLQLVSASVAWILVPRIGLVGVVAVTAVNTIGSYAAQMGVLKASGNAVDFRYPFGRLWRWLAAAFGAALGLAFSHWLNRAGEVFSSSRIGIATLGCLAVGVAVSATVVCSLLLKVPESHQMLDKLRDAVRTRRT